MTTTPRIETIEVPLPEGAHLTDADAEALRCLLKAIAGLRFDQHREWPGIRRDLESHGWSVTKDLQWHVEARRGREFEQACGGTLDEAFQSVWHAAGSGDAVEGTP